jgi:hypothetical protein
MLDPRSETSTSLDEGSRTIWCACGASCRGCEPRSGAASKAEKWSAAMKEEDGSEEMMSPVCGSRGSVVTFPVLYCYDQHFASTPTMHRDAP